MNDHSNKDHSTSVNKSYPLTRGQQLIWMSQSVVPTVPLYNMLTTFEIRGPLDHKRFLLACEYFVAASDALQTIFIAHEDSPPEQLRDPTIRANCQVIKLDTIDAVNDWANARCQEVLDLSRKAFDCVLLQIDDETHIIYWCQHHVIADGFSIELILRHLSNIYIALGESAATGTEYHLEDYPHTLDFITQQLEVERTSEYRQKLDYWQTRSDQPCDIPEFFGKTFDRTHAKSRRSWKLDASRLARLEQLITLPEFTSRSRNMSVFIVLATSMMATAYRLHGGEQLRLGFPARARNSSQWRESMGMFIGLGFLDVAVEPTLSFAALATRIREQMVETREHIAPGVQSSQMLRTITSNLNFVLARADSFDGRPVTSEFLTSGFAESNTQLDLLVTDLYGDSLYTFMFDFATSVFSPTDQEAYVEHFVCTLDALLDDCTRVITEYRLLSPDSEAKVLEVGRGQTAILPVPDTVHAHFVQQAARYPDKVAVKQNRRTLTFADLNKQSDVIATFLKAHGVGCGKVVAVCTERDMSMVPAILGIMKANAVYMPVDPEYPLARITYMVRDSQTKVVLGNAKTHQLITDENVLVIDLATVPTTALLEKDVTATDKDETLGNGVQAPEAAYLLYTSGSTGEPKGVIGTHQATLNRFVWMWQKYPFNPLEICAQKSALGFVDSIWELLGPLCKGVTVVVIPDDDVLDVFRFVDVLQAEKISRLVIVPSFLSVLLQSSSHLNERLASLKLCTVSGEALSMDLARHFLDKLGHCRLLNLYGSTEVAGDISYDEITHDKLSTRMPIGRPIDGVNILILDPQLNILPLGCVGEICVSGNALAAGYHALPEMNRIKFIDNPYATGRLYRTGDLGRFRVDGLLEHHGRLDTQLKIRGYRIELAEIEYHLRQFPEVAAAVVHAELDQLHAFYTVADDGRCDEAALADSLKATLPDYMMPAHFHVLGALPLLSNGKIDQQALKNQARLDSHEFEEHELPANDIESELAEVWCQCLGLEKVSTRIDFFDLGGNSITAMKIMVGLRKFNLEVSLKQILEYRTIEKLATVVKRSSIERLTESAGTNNQFDSTGIGKNANRESEDLNVIQALIKQHLGENGYSRVRDVYRLTPAQKGILFHVLLQGDLSQMYVAQGGIDLKGELKPEILHKAWDIVVQRHDALRSIVFHAGLHEPVQLVLESAQVPWKVHDLRHVASNLRQAAKDEILSQSLQQLLPLEQAPIERINLILMDDNLTHMFVDFHHIMQDGWSAAIIINDLMLCYAALLKGLPPVLPECGSFREHVVAVNRENRAESKHFWQAKLAGFNEPTYISNLENDKEGLHASGNLRLLIDEALTSELIAFASQCHVTPNTVIQAAWALVLSRYNATVDVLFGFAVSGRSSGIAHFENTVGMFVNSLPLRVHCDGNQVLGKWLQQVQSEIASLVQYENSSLSDIQSASSLPGQTTMFDSLMVFQNVPSVVFSSDLPIQLGERHNHENSHLPLTIEVFPEDSLRILMMYIPELFPEDRIQTLATHFVNTIKSIPAMGANAQVSDIGMMTTAELHVLTDSFNQTTREYDKNQSITDLIWEQAEKFPDHMALSCGPSCMSYREMTAQADALAAYLRSRGMVPDDLVGVCLKRELDLIVSLLAIQRAGLAYVPLDPDYPQARINHIVEDSGISLLITSSDLKMFWSIASECQVYLDQQRAEIFSHKSNSAEQQAQGHNLAYVMYTSGSTGNPKGVMVTRSNALNLILSTQERPGFDATDRLLAVTTFAFDISVLELFLPLVCGGRIDLAPGPMSYDGFALARRLEDQHISVMQATPTTWRLLLASDWQGSPDLKCLIGGEPLPADLVESLLPMVASIWNMYGPTETTVWSSCALITDSKSISIGQPIANTEILILDSYGQRCPINIPGELFISGEGVTNGYYNNEALTQQVFVPHPFKRDTGMSDTGARMYRTGDVARWLEDGRIECLGRADQQIKLRGNRIEIEEIETVLSRFYSIDHCAVALSGEHELEHLTAYIVQQNSSGQSLLDEQALRTHLRTYLPEYMVPTAYVLLDSLPRTPNGKLDRKTLATIYSGSSVASVMTGVNDYSLTENQPHTDMEIAMHAIWCEIMNLENISIRANYFDLGGNSITAMQIVSAAKMAGISITLAQVFELGTILALSAAVVVSSPINHDSLIDSAVDPVVDPMVDPMVESGVESGVEPEVEQTLETATTDDTKAEATTLGNATTNPVSSNPGSQKATHAPEDMKRIAELLKNLK